MEYNFRDIEKRWQQEWVKNKTYHVVEDKQKQKFYVLNMFPYPSGAGLHLSLIHISKQSEYPGHTAH